MAETFSCPNCGGDVPRKAKACPHCGSDEKTGWSEQTYLDGIDLSDDFDYEETIRREFGGGGRKLSPKTLIIGVVALVLIILFVSRYVL